MRLGEARTPEGMRLYAIGDVHGCDDLLAEAHRKIAEDLAARPVGDHRIVHVGDYGDRGPDTAAVIERLAGLTIADPHVVCLRGNHDEMLLGFLADPDDMGGTFIANGGEATLASYGVKVASSRCSSAITPTWPSASPRRCPPITSPSWRPAADRALRRLSSSAMPASARAFRSTASRRTTSSGSATRSC